MTSKRIPETLFKADSKVAIVTGCSRGIGEGVARRLLTDGWAGVLCARTLSALEEICAQSEQRGSQTLPVAGDLRDPSFAGEIVKKTLERFGQIDALVNIAGDAPQGHILNLTDMTGSRLSA